MDAVLGFLAVCPDAVPLVGFIGHASRTRFEDQHLVLAMLEIMREHRMFHPVHAGRPPFDSYLSEFCAALGIVDIMVGPKELKQRFKPYARPVELLDGLCGLVVFPAEDEEVIDADPKIIGFALELGIPVVAVRRSGPPRRWRPGQSVRRQ